MDHSASEKQTVRVTILSRSYTLRAAGDPREVEEVAASVNDLMLSIAGRAPDADSTRIAVLACLHLADQVRELERQLAGVKELRERLHAKTERVAGLLDRLIASAGEEG
jgi:cell division protein ZapA